MTPYITQLHNRRAFFQANYPPINWGLKPTSQEERKNTCPVCGYMTLSSRVDFQICTICFWEDDGSDDDSLNELSGPNHMTLLEARTDFEHTWERLHDSSNYDNEPINFLRKKFAELNTLIDNNSTADKRLITGLQKEIVDFLEGSKTYGLSTLLTCL